MTESLTFQSLAVCRRPPAFLQRFSLYMSRHGPSDAPPGVPPSLKFEFIDYQNPNTKSQIQRHTAHHAVRQRREAARQRLLRESSSGSRRFEWQRRSSISAPVSDGSASPGASSPSLATLRDNLVEPARPSRCHTMSEEAVHQQSSAQSENVNASETDIIFLTAIADNLNIPPAPLITIHNTEVQESLWQYCTSCVQRFTIPL